MCQRMFVYFLTWAVMGIVVPAEAQDADWSIRADVAEVCSCAITCPCNFGGQPNPPLCEGNRLIEITDGHYGDVVLDGVTFVVTFGMREWSKFYVSDDITDAQMAALDALLPLAFGGFHRTMLSISRSPVSVSRTGNRLSFSTSESQVDMETVMGLNDQPIIVHNLPSPALLDYTQQISVTHRHDSDDKTFSYAGTTGFRSRMEVGSP